MRFLALVEGAEMNRDRPVERRTVFVCSVKLFLNFKDLYVAMLSVGKGDTHCLGPLLHCYESLSGPQLQDCRVARVSWQTPTEALPSPVQESSLTGLETGIGPG